ncbi:MAG: hypothetical protein JWO67_2399, partial [Streptosporangiaceae bacterium]|nr:hypothetical protein [Streptosporangiaceae bacterium]
VGVAAAHFETEHDTTDVKFELVVLSRDDTVMVLERRDGNKLHYACPTCHRSRVVSQLERS